MRGRMQGEWSSDLSDDVNIEMCRRRSCQRSAMRRLGIGLLVCSPNWECGWKVTESAENGRLAMEIKAELKGTPWKVKPTIVTAEKSKVAEYQKDKGQVGFPMKDRQGTKRMKGTQLKLPGSTRHLADLQNSNLSERGPRIFKGRTEDLGQIRRRTDLVEM